MPSSLTAVRASLPSGTTLDDDAFARRHGVVRRLLALHVPALAVFGVLRDHDLVVVAGEIALVGLLAGLSGVARRHRRVATTVAAVGLVAASASVVHLSGGAVEARFHVVVALAAVALYLDWVPLAVAVVLAVAGDLAATGVDPTLVLPDGSRQDEPWLWAAIHTAIVLAVAVTAFALWRVADEEHRKGSRLGADLARAQSQIEARQSVSELFVNLARRNQALLDRQIDLIVGMEERETEPGQLAELFQLDHLATRMRRNAESLLVLSGEEPSRRWGRPVPLTDVVRAAVAEVEEYRRVDVAVDESVAVAGRAVADLAHLLAELVENGLQFSPPDSRVRVTSMPKGDRSCVVSVEDRGIGLSDMDLSSANDLLARPPEVDLRLSKRLGFHVVSRLAARYQLEVHLDATPRGGITASVRLPEELLASLDAPAPVAPTPRTARPAASTPTIAAQPAAPRPQPRPEYPVRHEPPAHLVPAAADVRPAVVAGRVVAPAPPLSPNPAPAPRGLPRRVPQASLSPQLREAVQRPAPVPGSRHAAPGAAERRSPEKVRSMLSNFQAGQQRGRQEIGAEPQPRTDACEER